MNEIDRKRARVRKLLTDPLWRGRSVRTIAKAAKVSPYLVHMVAEELGVEWPEVREYVNKHGNVTVMDTGRIGRRDAEVKLARALGRIGRVLKQYRGLKALAPLQAAFKQIQAEARKQRKRAG